MAYTVLARRYRSGTFDEVVGQGQIAQTLKKAIETDRIAHAYLFCGTRGTGKTSMARIMAKALNCQKFDKPTTTPCGKCESCLAVARGDDLDVIEIDAASNTGVDNVRDLIDNSRFSPARSRFKVYIIDEVHMLSKAAFNALLKTLEEPPSHVKFILATTEPEKVLPTIQSRCQRYDFRSIATREIADHLAQVCASEKMKADDDALMLVAKAGAGSMRDSLSLLDRLLSVGEKKVTVELIEGLLGLPKSQVIFDFVDTIGRGDAGAALQSADDIIRNGLSPDALLAALIDHLRNLLVLRTCGAQSKLVEMPGLDLKELDGQAQRFSAATLSQDIAILEELRRQMRVSQAGRAILDATLVRLALAEQFSTVEGLLGQASGNGATRSNAPRTTGGAATGANASGARPMSSAPSIEESAAPKKNDEVAASAPEEAPAPAEIEASSASDDAQIDASVDAPAAAPIETAPAPVAEISTGDDDDDDSLPAVGKVWDDATPTSSSLTMMFKRAGTQGRVPQRPNGAPATPARSNVEAVGPLSNGGDSGEIFSRLVARLGEGGPGIPGILAHATLVDIADDTATLRFPASAEFSARMLDRNGKKDVIRDALSDLLGRPTGLRVEIAPDDEAAPSAPARLPPAARPTPSASARPPGARVPTPPPAPMPEPTIRLTPELKEQLRADPLIAAVLRELGGEIVKVE